MRPQQHHTIWISIRGPARAWAPLVLCMHATATACRGMAAGLLCSCGEASRQLHMHSAPPYWICIIPAIWPYEVATCHSR